MHKNQNCLKINKDTYPPLESLLYAILVLPKKALPLIEVKYHDFVDKNPILYEEESCKKCIKYYSEKEKDFKKIREHKKNHKNISFTDIETIIEKFTDYIS